MAQIEERNIADGTTAEPVSRIRMGGGGDTCQVAVVGAGPYGLATAAHLRAAGVETRVFGDPLAFWRCNMPRGMMLRSPWAGCHISDPRRAHTLDSYFAERRAPRTELVSLEAFVDYGAWFQRRVVPDLDRRRIERLESGPHGFRLWLNDGEQIRAASVVVAAGLASQAHRPPEFQGVPGALASHASEQADFAPFAGRHVVVVGGGQAALESAVLLKEAGADVDVVVRHPRVYWLGLGSRGLLHHLIRRLEPAAPLGPFPLSWAVELPDIYRSLTRGLQQRVAARALRPAGAGWLVPRAGGVRFRTGVRVSQARRSGEQVALTLDDGTGLSADHVLLCTGYKVDVARYGFLSPALVGAVERENGRPVLRPGFESSVPGLHFVGAAADRSFGPLMRFIGGTGYAARAVTKRVLASTSGTGAPCRPA